MYLSNIVFFLLALTGGQPGSLQGKQPGRAARLGRRRRASGDPYWAYSGERDCQPDK